MDSWRYAVQTARFQHYSRHMWKYTYRPAQSRWLWQSWCYGHSASNKVDQSVEGPYFRWYQLLGVNLLLRLVDVGASFAHVEWCLIQTVDTINLEKGCVLVLVSQSTLETSEDGLHVKPTRDSYYTLITDHQRVRYIVLEWMPLGNLNGTGLRLFETFKSDPCTAQSEVTRSSSSGQSCETAPQ